MAFWPKHAYTTQIQLLLTLRNAPQKQEQINHMEVDHKRSTSISFSEQLKEMEENTITYS